MCHYSFTSMCHHHHHVCQPSLALSPGRSRDSPISSPFISCTFAFNRSTPRTFYPPHIPTYPTFAVSYHSLAYYFLLYMSFLLHAHSSSHFCFLVFHTTFLHTYLSTLSPIRRILTTFPSSTSHQQIHFSKHARAKTYCLKYSLPPATLSLSLPRRRLGRTRW